MKIQTIRLNGGTGIEVTVDWNDKKKCKCGKEIWFAKTTKNKLIPIELVSLANWQTHFATCKFADEFRKKRGKNAI